LKTPLEKAKAKYKDYLRNYLHYKDQVEDYYNENNSEKHNKKEILIIESKMNHCYDMLETLVYIFGEDVRK
jgi:hypothetical protein